MKVFAIIWIAIIAIIMAVLGISTIVNAPVQWLSAILMLMSSAGLFIMGMMLTKDSNG